MYGMIAAPAALLVYSCLYFVLNALHAFSLGTFEILPGAFTNDSCKNRTLSRKAVQTRTPGIGPVIGLIDNTEVE